MKKILAAIIRNPQQPPNVRVSAISLKQRLDFETQDKHELGPGAPLSKQDAIDRLALLMKACGPDIVDAAVSLAFGTVDEEKTMDSSNAVETPTEDPSGPTSVTPVRSDQEPISES